MLKAYTTVSILVALDFVAPGCSPSSGRTAQTNAADSGGGSSFNGGGGTTSSTTPNQDGGFIVSTSGGSGGAGGDTDCGRNYFPVEQKPADMLLVLDRSASMEDGTPSKWSIVIPALHGVVTPRLLRFGGVSKCSPWELTPNARQAPFLPVWW